jgi:DNA-directed RNA polymerase subunit M/transcription elongation factor TFIIS
MLITNLPANFMGKESRGAIDQVKILKSQNRALKLEVSKLRKLIKRSDFSRLDEIDKAIDKQHAEEQAKKREDNKLKAIKEKYRCHECGDGIMYLYILQMGDSDKFYRRCDCCGHRTPSALLTDEVNGILPNGELV